MRRAGPIMNWMQREQPRPANVFLGALSDSRSEPPGLWLFGALPAGAAGHTVTGADGALGRLLAENIQTLGLDTLTGGRRAFVGVDRETLLEGLPASLSTRPDRCRSAGHGGG